MFNSISPAYRARAYCMHALSPAFCARALLGDAPKAAGALRNQIPKAVGAPKAADVPKAACT